ncbi:MAG: 50S ribosomal protein L29 [Terriglobia bacterium]
MKFEKKLKAEKIREWGADELKNKEREYADQLFRLKFQFASGQTDTLPNLRVLRKNLAKVKTIRREQEIAAAGTKKS